MEYQYQIFFPPRKHSAKLPLNYERTSRGHIPEQKKIGDETFEVGIGSQIWKGKLDT